ncbi:MAG: ABC transporter permease [Sulfuritalea sp.]|jgi:phospholipid/cholesterol/gamma-HCH transport system permease protein|nr:ABC transporter permease [Sulfuritalea sp.]
MRDQAAWQLDVRPAVGGDADTLVIVFGGRWRIDQSLPAPDTLKDRLDASVRRVRFDANELADWDSGLLSFVSEISKSCADRGIAVDGSGLPPGALRLLTMAQAVPEQKLAERDKGPQGSFAQVGTATLEFFRGLPQMLDFLGEVALSLLRLLSGRAGFRARDLWLEIEEIGPRALPIVSVISFLVGLILAYLGADQLKLVGAQIFIADLVAIGMVREIGALMTGVIIAGRTGAAFAAQLGTMQVNEEIDAFKTLGISAIDFLVLPRILALMLMVPLLTLYSGFIGMLAGLLVSATIFDIGVFEYYTETLRALDFRQFAVGLSKGAVYGAMIAFSGCLRGMQCGRSAEAVGHAATSAVVTAILLITISASIMTIVYYQLGI